MRPGLGRSRLQFELHCSGGLRSRQLLYTTSGRQPKIAWAVSCENKQCKPLSKNTGDSSALFFSANITVARGCSHRAGNHACTFAPGENRSSRTHTMRAIVEPDSSRDDPPLNSIPLFFERTYRQGARGEISIAWCFGRIDYIFCTSTTQGTCATYDGDWTCRPHAFYLLCRLPESGFNLVTVSPPSPTSAVQTFPRYAGVTSPQLGSGRYVQMSSPRSTLTATQRWEQDLNSNVTVPSNTICLFRATEAVLIRPLCGFYALLLVPVSADPGSRIPLCVPPYQLWGPAGGRGDSPASSRFPRAMTIAALGHGRARQERVPAAVAVLPQAGAHRHYPSTIRDRECLLENAAGGGSSPARLYSSTRCAVFSYTSCCNTNACARTQAFVFPSQ